jgi:hypothetical protein
LTKKKINFMCLTNLDNFSFLNINNQYCLYLKFKIILFNYIRGLMTKIRQINIILKNVKTFPNLEFCI